MNKTAHVMPKTAVVIPNYNGLHYLKNCMESLTRCESISNVIIVDNGSEDGSVEWIEQQQESKLWDHRLQGIFLSENTGFCKAVNEGIKSAAKQDANYVILLNNDTTVEPDFASQLIARMEQNPKLFSAASRLLNMKQPELLDDGGDYYCALGWAYAAGKDRPATNYQTGKKIFAACAAAAIYRISCLNEIGLLDENHFAYLEDIDLGYRAQIYGYQNVYVPEAVVYHAGSGASGSRHNAFKVSLSSKNSIYLVYKNMPVLQLLLNLPFLLLGYLVKLLFFCKKGLGKEYLMGLRKGFALCASKQGRAHKVPFRWSHIGNYLWIQWQLWVNLLRRCLEKI